MKQLLYEIKSFTVKKPNVLIHWKGFDGLTRDLTYNITAARGLSKPFQKSQCRGSCEDNLVIRTT